MCSVLTGNQENGNGRRNQMTTNIWEMSATQAHELLRKKKISATEILDSCIERIEEVDGYLNALPERCFARAKKLANRIDENSSPKSPVDLLGLPIAVKDYNDLSGVRTTYGSTIFKDNIPTNSDRTIKVLENNGANPVAKSNVPEWAGGHTFNPVNGLTRNPWDLSKSAGGSSGGSASALAAQLTPITIGTDTGGSIRQPASFTGTVGLKPTYGSCSRYGIVAFASSLDQAGPMAQNVKDCALLQEVISSYDDKDSTSIDFKRNEYSKELTNNIKGKKIGIPKEYRVEGMPKEIEELWKKGIEYAKDCGAEIIDISLPHTSYALPTYYIVAPAEASSNLARYDGVKYGFRAQGENLIDMYEKTRSEGFGNEVQRRIMIGTYVLSSGYYDAYYLKAQKVRKLIKNDFDEVYKKVDAILTPSTPSSAFKIGEKKDDPVSMYLNDIFTVPVNLAGLPGISIPAGHDSKGYPLGLQIIGKAFDEQNILNIAYAIEQKINFKNKITDWWIK